MSYVSLYRKYRPKKFSEVVGQDIVIKILKNSIKNNKIGHAYIFSGPRGTGKTSVAKIFSKAVNCLSNKDGDLCGECSVCNLNFDDEIDLIEIDAASNNGVDEIREIRNNANLLPAHLKYKVYIIDEVHMLSISAFNALLKTLEEPPENIIFILATTEFGKIPATIVSRCQKFDFKKLTDQQIFDRLKYILKEENKKFDDEVISVISQLSDGGMRDAINMLDQLISMQKTSITVDDVYNLIGDVNDDTIAEILHLICSTNIKELMKKIDNLYNSGKNFINISERIQVLIRNIIIYNNTDNYFNKNQEEKLNKFSKVDVDLLLKLSTEIFNLINELKKTTNQRIIMEIYSLKMALIFNNKKAIKIENKEQIKKEESKEINIKLNTENIVDVEMKKIKINNVFFGADKKLKNDFLKDFQNIKEYISSKEYNSVANLMLKSKPEVVSSNNILFTFKSDLEVVLFEKNEEEIQKLLKQIYNKKYSIVAVTIDQWSNIKQEYIDNIKQGIKYKYIDENKKEKKNKNKSKLESTAEGLFGEEIIKID